MTRILPIATFALAIAACSAADAGQSGLGPSQDAQVRGACSQLGLSAGQVQYDDCVVSLSRSVASRDAAGSAQQARAECSQAGPRGTPEFANCVLDHDQALAH
jgi:hypothetical protein